MSNQPLPHGWIREMDRMTNRPYYVDNNANPPRAIWEHPYEDQQYLLEHPEVRQELDNRRRPVERRTVEQMTADRLCLDITAYIRRDPQYQFPIGAGGGGNIYRGFYRCIDPNTNQEQNLNIVIKCLKGTLAQNPKTEQRVNREIASWHNLKHPNIAELLGIAYLNPDLPPGLVSRYVLRHDFLAYIGKHPELKRRKAQEIASGVHYLHEHGVVHGDLKVDNVLISDHHIAQITDFGIARILGVDGFTTMVERNVRTTAPELMPIWITNEDLRPTPQSDIFSLGILFLQLFHGPDRDKQRGRPYNHIDQDGAVPACVHGGDRPRPIRNRYNWIQDPHWTLIQQCWAGRPSDRPEIIEVLRAL